MSDLTEKSKVAWPLVVAFTLLAFSAGGAWIQITSHGTKLDDHETRLRDHQERLQRTEDHYEAIKAWMDAHK